MRGYAMHKNRPWPVGNAHSTTLTQHSHYTHTAPALHSAKLRLMLSSLPCLSHSLPPRCSCLSFFVLNCFVYDFVPQLAFLICCPPTTPALPLPLPTVSCCQVQLIPIGDESSLGFAGFPGPPSSSAFGLVLRFCLFAL